MAKAWKKTELTFTLVIVIRTETVQIVTINVQQNWLSKANIVLAICLAEKYFQ